LCRKKDSFRLESLETDFLPVNSLTGYLSSLAFGMVTSFFGIKGVFFAFLSKSEKANLRQIFFQGLGENTYSIQPALKSTAPGL